jgi:hypothetical protein
MRKDFKHRIALAERNTQMQTEKIFKVRDPDITGNFRLVQDTASTATSR